MPMSDPSEFLLKVSQVLLLLLLLLTQRRLAQYIPPRLNNPVPESDVDTFSNSHIVLPNIEMSYYLLRNTDKNLTFVLDKHDQVNYFTLTLTTCGVRVKWFLLVSKGKTFTELGQYEGEGRQTHKQQNPKTGVYLLSITSLVNDSYVNVYLSYDMHSAYPNLPPDPRIDVSTNNSLLALSWQSASRYNIQPVEYCLAINRVKRLHSYCGAMAYLKGAKKPPSKTIWGTAQEREQLAELAKNAKPIKKWSGKKLFYQCVSNKTSFTYGKVRRGKTYFVDVFVLVNKGNKKVASAYSSTEVKIKRTKNSSTLRMKVGETKTLKLKYQYKVILQLNTTITKLAFEVMPCGGKIPFEIQYNGRKIQRKTFVKRWHRRLLQIAYPGIYILTFPRTKRTTFVTISIKTNATRSKIVLPTKFLIRASQRMSSCPSVRLEWTAAKIKQKYCVYRREVKGHDQLRRRCQSLEKRPLAERLACFYSNGTDATSEQKMDYSVQGLRPGARYRFDVFVSRGQSSSLSYKSVTVKTNRCHKSKG